MYSHGCHLSGIMLSLIVLNVCLYFSFVCGHIHQNTELHAERGDYKNGYFVTLEDVVHALEKVAAYFSKMKQNSTVDFAFGMRIAEGEILRVLNLSDTGVYAEVTRNSHLRKRLLDLTTLIKNSVQQSLPHIKRSYSKDYERLKFVIENTWEFYQLPPQFTEKNDISVFPNNFDDGTLKELESDICMGEVLGTDGNEVCSVERCWDKMTKPGHILYYPTHQLLWLLLGYKKGCYDKLNKLAVDKGFPGGFDDVINRRCAGIFIEMEAISKDGFNPAFRDIFMEQGFLCAGIGFMHKSMLNWLLIVLKWQKLETGCFTNVDEPENMDEDLKQFEYWINFQRDQWKSRKILVDTVLEDGCSTHQAAMAARFLATYLRPFVDPILQQQVMMSYWKDSPDDDAASFHASSLNLLFVPLVAICIVVLYRRKILLQGFGFLLRRLKAMHTTCIVTSQTISTAEPGRVGGVRIVQD